MGSLQNRILLMVLAAAGMSAIVFKLLVVHVGAPYVTVDDNTMYEAGFLVWFGQAPPQRMFLESWITGLISILTHLGTSADLGAALNPNVVADAWREFHANPDPFVHSYRWFALTVDLATVALVYGIARQVFRQPEERLPALLVAVLYLLSFNTVWNDVVARPDTLTAFFAAAGMLLYLKSDRGTRTGCLYAGAAAFGLAAGMKLHAAMFTVFAILDLVRVLGVRAAWRRAMLFGAIAVLVFCVASGSPLFDPLLYLKLRYLNAIDDASPWIEWGEQLLVVIYGSGWLTVPLIALGTVQAIRSGAWRSGTAISSVLLFALGWLVLFCAIRQLRSYWMLPALPVLYLAGVWGIWSIRHAWARLAVSVALAGIMLVQSHGQMQDLRSTAYGELRAWIGANVGPGEPLYLLGYSGIGLPYSTAAIEDRRAGIERKLRASVDAGEPFTQRHVRLWEERAELMLLDMLDYRSGTGHTWYGYHDVPLEDYAGIVAWDDFRFVVVQEHFGFEEEAGLEASLRESFTEVARLTGPGGHANGLEYIVYERM